MSRSEQPKYPVAAFEVRNSVGPDGSVVAPHGELDLSTCDQLAEALDAALLSDAERVLLDLRGLQFIDSNGLKAILVAHATAAERGTEFVIRRGPDSVQRVFEVTTTDGHLTFLD
jgi:anti-anti-sigma factor